MVSITNFKMFVTSLIFMGAGLILFFLKNDSLGVLIFLLAFGLSSDSRQFAVYVFKYIRDYFFTKTGEKQNEKTSKSNKKFDVFICHASEDKDSFVSPLAEHLRSEGLEVWYDDFTLKLGDSIRQKIDRGLYDSRYGLVVISKSFFQKKWPQRELDGLFAREVNGEKVILPIWHQVTMEDVVKYSPMLADRFAMSSDESLEKIVQEILEVVVKRTSPKKYNG